MTHPTGTDQELHAPRLTWVSWVSLIGTALVLQVLGRLGGRYAGNERVGVAVGTILSFCLVPFWLLRRHWSWRVALVLVGTGTAIAAVDWFYPP